jgi:hypothetical protein
MTRGTHVSLEKFSLAEAIVQLPDNFELKKILLMIWRREQGQIERVEAGLAVYFDQCMDRVSGWYKRDAQVRSVCFGLVLAVLLNIDAVHIASALWQDRDLARSTATKAAPPGQSQIAGDKAQEVRLPAELPLGWPPRWYTEWQQQLPDSGDAGRRKTDATLQFVWHVAAAILGFILMGLSCLIAAPVWYQLLASLLPLRAAGPVPGRSADNTRTDATLPAGTQEPDASRTVPLLQPNDLERQLMANNRVKEVQTWLRAPNTGVFDAETRLAIRNAQSAYGFAPTGQLTQWLLIQLQQRVAAN